MRAQLWIALVVVAGCGDDGGARRDPPDAAVVADGAIDAAVVADAAIDERRGVPGERRPVPGLS